LILKNLIGSIHAFKSYMACHDFLEVVLVVIVLLCISSWSTQLWVTHVFGYESSS